jgi:hypothetical protein
LVSVVSPVNYRILRAILTSKTPFTQHEIAAASRASAPQTSRVVRWLTQNSGITRTSGGRYQVRGPASILTSLFPYQRSMKDAETAVVDVRGNVPQITEFLVSEGGILCLESALSEYSEYYRPTRICAYHISPGRILSSLSSRAGGIVPVHLFLPDIPLEGDVEMGRRTSRYRTLVDLVCDGNAYAAKDLFEQLWGIVLD